VTEERLVHEVRSRRAKRPSRRDLVTSALLGGGFLVTAVAIATGGSWNRSWSVVELAALVAAYALLSRIELEVGPGSAVPIQLVFVPMLFVLPVPLVPLCVAAGYVLGALPEYLRGHVHPARAFALLSSSWYSLGPAIVLSLAPTDGRALSTTPILLAALASQFLFDGLSSLIRERFAFGHSPKSLVSSLAWIWSVDSLLAPIGLVAALSGRLGLLLVLPLAGLLQALARERRDRIDRAVSFGQAYRGALDDAHRDELSGLGNRRKLVSDLTRLSAAPARELVLVVYDLNGFKDYNDTFGHPAGDALLRRLAGKLAEAVDPARGEPYRLGGDEFCVLAAPPEEGVERLLDDTVEALSEEGDGFLVSTCFGAAFIPSEAQDASSALTIADRRLYAQKQATKVSRGQPHTVLLEAMFERDPDLREHGRRVAAHAVAVGSRLGFDGRKLEELTLAAELHDIGKIAIPDAVLKRPGALGDDERKLMQQHTVIGQRILAAVPALQTVGTIVRATHERWDGKGYTDGLAGHAIPLAARIIAVCDAFEAMTSTRPYAASRTAFDALKELRRCAGTQFDPDIVRAFSDVFQENQGRVASAAA
jgi:diguanylate cyclase (GGDEF)-like protein